MAGEWGKDISRILTMSKENNAAVDSRLATLTIQSDNEYVRLHNLIQETKTQQTVLMATMELMETQLAQIPILGEGSESPSPEPVHLPSTLFGEDVGPQSHPIIGDSVTSPMHSHQKKGPKLSPSPVQSPVKVFV